MYEYEAEVMVIPKDGGRCTRKFKVAYNKPKERWMTFDYDNIERSLRKKVNGDASIIEVRSMNEQRA